MEENTKKAINENMKKYLEEKIVRNRKNDEDDLEEDIIIQIYQNKLETIQKKPECEEYKEMTKKIREIEKTLLQTSQEDKIEELIECINARAGIEAKYQFRLGFRTAMRIIIDSLK